MSFAVTLDARSCSSCPLALLVAYLIVQRQRRKYAVRFTSVDLLASVAPAVPAGSGTSPPRSLVVACSLLGRSVSPDPTTKVKVPKQQGTIMLAIDTSGSMAATDVAPTRLAAAEGRGRAVRQGFPPG